MAPERHIAETERGRVVARNFDKSTVDLDFGKFIPSLLSDLKKKKEFFCLSCIFVYLLVCSLS